MHDKVTFVWSCISNKQARNERERMAEDIVATLNGDFFGGGGKEVMIMVHIFQFI